MSVRNTDLHQNTQAAHSNVLLLDMLARLGVDRRDFPSRETYLSLSLSSTILARPRSAMEAAHRQRRVVQYGDDGVVVLLQGRSPACSMAMVRRRWSFPSPQRPLSIGLGLDGGEH